MMCLIFLCLFCEVEMMKRLTMDTSNVLTFEEGCNKYIDNCRQRNLREGTINHYKQSYTQFYKYFDPDMPVEDFTEDTYKEYVLHLKEILHNDVSINSYIQKHSKDFGGTLDDPDVIKLCDCSRNSIINIKNH